jgi:hypothetical protein
VASTDGSDLVPVGVPVGLAIGWIVLGLLWLTFGIAALLNKVIAVYTPRKRVSAWASMPLLGRRTAPMVGRAMVRTVRLFKGVTLTAFGALAVVLGVLSLRQR